MDHGRIELGAVYRWSHDDRLMRVLMHDDSVVMYDAWWEHLGNWGLADLQQVKKKRIHYYVTTVGTVLEKAAYVRTEPLSGDEITLHRPDLPFSFAQCAAVSWPAEIPGAAAQMAARVRAAGCRDARDGATLGAAEAYLFPFGPKGGQKAGVRVRADNKAAFTAEEILWKAAAVQAPHIGDEAAVQGMGIYRLGLQRGVPGFYLWGNVSRLHSYLASRDTGSGQG
jgi:hypothetical protein